MSDDVFISVQNLSKHFGAVKAVDDVSFDIRPGEFFSLLGPSGCGKTTLMRIIAGFEEATRGDVLIDGQPMGNIPPHERPVNMVFQNYAIFPHLTVEQNIAFGLRKQKLTKKERSRLVEDALEMIKLPGYGPRAAHQLSGGQRQRIALARALIKKPKVLLLDEPLGALDKKLREQMQLELRALQKSVGITFIFVTHDQEEAMTMSDRIAVMNDGRALEIDTPSKLYEHPRSHFVANFLGSMNFFHGRVAEIRANTLLVDTREAGRLQVATELTDVERGSDVLVAIRPENMKVSEQKPDERLNAVKGLIDTAAFLGDRSHLYVSVNDGRDTVLALVQNQGGATSRIDGEANEVWLSWSNDATIVLPAQDP